MVKTIKLSGSEIKVTGLGGDNTEIFNNGNETIYASKLPKITVGGDDVIAIPAGAIDGLYGTRGTIYLLGSGSVELRGVDHKITKARGSSGLGSVAGVSQGYVDENDKKTLTAAKAYADSVNAELAGFVGYTDSDIYGLEADFENCKFARLAGAVGKNAGADFDSVRAYGGRRRCNLSDSGEVLAYYGDENFKADGSNGQVMVEQPKFYYRVVPLKTEKFDDADGYHLRKARYYISDTPKAGFKIHPAFVRNGIEVDKIYLSAFEGSIYDTSAGNYLLNDEQIADFDNDMLSSIAGAKPCSGQSQSLTRANSRKIAHNRGDGWEISTIQEVSATQLLFVIEYASFDSQSNVGIGAVEKVNTSGNLAVETGSTLLLGNKSGNLVNAENVQSVTYRGSENLWGNIWNFIDGINVNDSEVFSEDQYGNLYIADCDFVDDIYNGVYKKANINICPGTGFVSAFCYSSDYDWLFISSEYAGNSALPVGDRVWNDTLGKRLPVQGGMWHHETLAGIFSLNFNITALSNGRHTNSRITYFPQK